MGDAKPHQADRGEVKGRLCDPAGPGWERQAAGQALLRSFTLVDADKWKMAVCWGWDFSPTETCREI